jgi:hypothetical protein
VTPPGSLTGWGVRRRSTAAAALIVLLVVAVAGAVLLEVLGRAAVGAAQDQAVTRQTEILRDLGLRRDPGGGGDSTVYTRAGPAELMLHLGRPGVIVQLQNAQGRVVAASPAAALGADLDVPVLEPGQHLESADLGDGPAFPPEDYVYVANGIQVNDVPLTLAVAVPMSLQQDVLRTVVLFLLVGGPVLVLLGGALMWILVGRRPATRSPRWPPP